MFLNVPTLVQLHDQLMDARYALEEKTEEVIRLKDQLKEITLDRDSRPVVSPDATASIKDEALAQLDQERRELQCILADSDANYDAAIRRAKQTARKELQLRCESLEGQLEAQKALHADALAQVDAERRVPWFLCSLACARR